MTAPPARARCTRTTLQQQAAAAALEQRLRRHSSAAALCAHCTVTPVRVPSAAGSGGEKEQGSGAPISLPSLLLAAAAVGWGSSSSSSEAPSAASQAADLRGSIAGRLSEGPGGRSRLQMSWLTVWEDRPRPVLRQNDTSLLRPCAIVSSETTHRWLPCPFSRSGLPATEPIGVERANLPPIKASLPCPCCPLLSQAEGPP